MGQKENNLKNEVDAGLTTWQRLWRINCGFGWISSRVEKCKGFIKLYNARPFRGADKGLSDCIGFDSIIITPEMVGQRVAIFVGSELKATKNDKLKTDQTNFKNLIVKMGGLHREHRPDGVVIESGFKRFSTKSTIRRA